MPDLRIVLDELIFELFYRQDRLRDRLSGERPEAKPQREALYRQLNLLNDGYIRLCHDDEGGQREDWMAFTDLAIAIGKGIDEIEASLPAIAPRQTTSKPCDQS